MTNYSNDNQDLESLITKSDFKRSQYACAHILTEISSLNSRWYSSIIFGRYWVQISA